LSCGGDHLGFQSINLLEGHIWNVISMWRFHHKCGFWEKYILNNLSQSGIIIGMSEWMLFNANSAIFQLSWGDEVRFNVLEQQVWCYWNNSQQIDMSPHSDTLSWLVNQSLLFLLNAACLAEISNKLQFYSLWFDLIRARIHNLSPLRWVR
jgi:hypothetical protein